MPEQKMKKPKPKIDEFAREQLSGDTLKNFLRFLEFLKDNKLNPRAQSKHVWTFWYKGLRVCYIMIFKDLWAVTDLGRYSDGEVFKDLEKHLTDDSLKQYIIDNARVPKCDGCNGSANIPNFLKGKFEELCSCCPLRINNPESESFEYAKELVLITKIIIEDTAASKK